MNARQSVLSGLFLLSAFGVGCSRSSSGDPAGPSANPVASGSTTLSSADVSIPEDLAPGATPTWPAPQMWPDRPIGTRIAHSGGRDVLWAYGGKDIEGLAVMVRWRDPSGTLIGWTTMTGGSFTATDGWWQYTTMSRMPTASAVEAQIYSVRYSNGKKWSSPGFDWRYRPTKATTVQNGIGIEVLAVEREWSSNELEGKIFLEVYNETSKPLKRVDISCDLKDQTGKIVTSDLSVAWVPRMGDDPHPLLLPGEHDQVDGRTSLDTDADRAAWSKKGLAPTCKVTEAK